MSTGQDRGVRIGGSWRSPVTGHRVAVRGVQPRQSRELPWWTWPAEFRDRRRARLAGQWLGLVAAAGTVRAA